MIRVFQLLLAGNTMVFCNAQVIVSCFQVVSSLRVNLAKSELVAIWEWVDKSLVARVLGCKEGSCLLYAWGCLLGLSLGQW